MIKSDKLNCKVDDISEVVEDFKCAFKTLEEDVHVLETANNLLNVQQTEAATNAPEALTDATTKQLEAIQDTVKGKKETAEAVLEFSHPCGGHGWKQVAYMDFREEGTDCPPEFTEGMYPAQPHACVPESVSSGECRHKQFTHTESFSSVCGRIDAYQFGITSAFAPFLDSGATINQAYLSGVSLTRGGDLSSSTGPLATHIWSFAAGQTQSTTSSATIARCPCDNGPAPPDFVGEDYFCEASSTLALGTGDVPSNANNDVFFPGNLLWDGLGCATAGTSSCCASDCCSRIDHPYFVKHLGVPTQDPIDLRVCLFQSSIIENIALERIELYVK